MYDWAVDAQRGQPLLGVVSKQEHAIMTWLEADPVTSAWYIVTGTADDSYGNDASQTRRGASRPAQRVAARS